MMSRMLQIVSNVVVIAAIAYLTFLYQKVLAPFSEKYSEEIRSGDCSHELVGREIDDGHLRKHSPFPPWCLRSRGRA